MTKYEEFRRGQPRVTERFPDLAPPLAFLSDQQDAHFRLVHRLLGTTQDEGPTPLFSVVEPNACVLGPANFTGVAAIHVPMVVDERMTVALTNVGHATSKSLRFIDGDKPTING